MSFFSPPPTFFAFYLKGNNELKPLSPVNLKILKEGVEVSIPFSSKKILNWDKIKEVRKETEGSIQQSKTFSGGKALLGLALLGPLGLVFGAGGKTHTHDTRKNFLLIDYIDDTEAISTIAFSCKDAEKFCNLFEVKKYEMSLK